MSLENDPVAHAKVLEDGKRWLDAFNQGMTVSEVEFTAYRDLRDTGSSSENGYQDSRTKQDVAVKLGTTVTQLSRLVHGKEVLDIGCGT